MKTYLLLLPALLSLPLLAHEGHPGTAGHGAVTHLMLGLALSLPVWTVALILRARTRRRAAAETVRKEDV